MTFAMANETKNQHYVPQFYLRRWTDNQGKLWNSRVVDGRFLSSRTHPRSTAYRTDLYQATSGIAWQPLPPRDFIENTVMRSVDDAGADALAHLEKLGAESLPEPAQRAWAQFLVAAHHRDPYLLSKSDRRVTEIAHCVVSDMRDQFGRTPEELCRLNETLAYVDPVEMARGVVRTTMVHAIRSDDAVDRVLSMRWYVARGNFELVTTDRPLLMNLGQSTPLEILSIALGPQALFVATPPWVEESDDEILELVRNLAAFHNLLLLVGTQPRHVYSRYPLKDTPTCPLRTIVEERLRAFGTTADELLLN